ncbi:MAG: endonuclease/exonuclease/phosphatase family protein [Rhodobacteraceae bacterium]|nr:endonuclease/exonuclease/phosphatase family protein [Paracoccaceae bacterium]
MFYSALNRNKDKKRIAVRLLALKQKLANEVPLKCTTNTLIATWNIREFDNKSYGIRSDECLFYIAEIISHFDIIAVQEVREDLTALKRVMRILGRGNWQYIVSDVSEGKPGNRERMAFIYDTRSVSFASEAGEVVMPAIEVKQGNKTLRYDPAKQLYRTPYMCSFQSRWSKLMLCTVHILYGKDKADNPNRVEEIKLIADLLAKRARSNSTPANLVLLGDFNIYKPKDITMKALTDAGFFIDKSLQKLPQTNTGKKARFYDQIAFLPRNEKLEPTGKAGVFDFYETVYTKADEALYVTEMGASYHTTSAGKPRANKSLYYNTYWRTFQMSDHLPMWVQIRTDFAQEYLENLAKD